MDFLTSPTLSASIQHTTRPSSKCANVWEIISCFFKCPSVIYFHRWLIRLTVAWMGIINFDQLVIGVSCNIFLDYRTKGSGSMRLLYLRVYIDIISTSWRIAVHAALSGLTEIRPIIIRPQNTVISVEIHYNCGTRLNYSVYVVAMRHEASYLYLLLFLFVVKWFTMMTPSCDVRVSVRSRCMRRRYWRNWFVWLWFRLQRQNLRQPWVYAAVMSTPRWFVSCGIKATA